MANLIERARDIFRGRQAESEDAYKSAAKSLLEESKKHGGILLGEEDGPYRLLVTADALRVYRQRDGKQVVDEEEKERVAEWIQDYLPQAWMAQISLNVAAEAPSFQQDK